MKTKHLIRTAIIVSATLSASSLLATSPDTVNIADGATVDLVTGTFYDIFTSTTISSTSTALIDAVGTVDFEGELTGYYGFLKVANGLAFTFNPSTGSGNAKLTLGDPSFTSSTTFLKKGGAYQLLGYNGDDNTIVMDKYGVLDLTDADNGGALTLGKSLQMNSAADTHAPYLKFRLTTADTTQGTPAAGAPVIAIIAGNITTDQTDGKISPTKNLSVDVSTASSSTPGGTVNFTLATSGDTPFAIDTSAVNVTGNDSGLWDTIAAYVNANSGSGGNLGVSMKFDPLFADSTPHYTATLAAALSYTPSQLTLLRNWTGASTTFINDLTFDMNGKTITGTFTFSIASSKMLTLKGAQFPGKISFGNSTSKLCVVGNNILDPTVGYFGSSAGPGSLQIGDGTTATSQTLYESLLNGIITTIQVKGNATLTLGQTPPS